MKPVDIAHIKECLLSCVEEFEQLVYDKEWYVTDVIDQLESSLEIIKSEEKRQNDDAS